MQTEFAVRSASYAFITIAIQLRFKLDSRLTRLRFDTIWHVWRSVRAFKTKKLTCSFFPSVDLRAKGVAY
jgi:hypothetical protein